MLRLDDGSRSRRKEELQRWANARTDRTKREIERERECAEHE
jgi:hypothetical protein